MAQEKSKHYHSKNQRNSSVCPISKKCGGCQFLDITYEEELNKKNAKMKSLLGSFGTVDKVLGAKE